MKRLIKRVNTFGLALMMFFGANMVVYADDRQQEYIRGELNTSGALVQYSTRRTHLYDGPIILHVDKMPYGHLRLGLCDTSGNQFTESLQWDHCGGKQWNGVPYGKTFIFQGRMKRTGLWTASNTWGGYLFY